MILRVILVLLVLMQPIALYALGLGKLKLESALNQKFQAKIALLSATAEDLASIEIGLADLQAFRRANIELTPDLDSLVFTVDVTEAGAYIRIRSKRVIREPFLYFLIDVNWSNGRLLREYAILLDPPNYNVPVAKKSFPSKTISAKSPKPQKKSLAPKEPYISGSYGPAVRGDTLWDIAQGVRAGSSISIQKMMLAIFSMNPEAFIDNNINGLKRGAILQIPDLSSANFLHQKDAFAQVHNQNQLWDIYKGKSSQQKPPELPTDITGLIAEPPADITELVDEPPVDITELVDEPPADITELVDEPHEDIKEPVAESEVVLADDSAQLRLLSEPLEATDQQGDNVSDEDLENHLAVTNESIEVIKLSNADINDNLTETELIITDLDRLIELKTNELSALQEKTLENVEIIDETIEEVVSEEVVSEEAVLEEGVEGIAADSFSLSNLISMIKKHLILILSGLLGILLFCFSVLFFFKRYKEKKLTEDFLDEKGVSMLPDIQEEDVTVVSEEIAEPAVLEHITKAEDILEEVNTFLAYEHFSEAESFVRDALEDDPENLDIHAKLLEVFYAANNKSAYEEAAKNVYDKTGGAGEYWDMAVVMWQEISPNQMLFETSGVAEADESDSAQQKNVDVVNIMEDTAAIDPSSSADQLEQTMNIESVEEEMEFDISTDSTKNSAEDEMEMEFDISTDSTKNSAEDEMEMEFDISTDSTKDAAEEEMEIEFDIGTDAAEDEMEMEFDISTDSTKETAEEEMEIEFDISTDSTKETAEDEMDIGLDIGTDAAEEEMDVEFDIGTDAAEEEMDIGLDISTDVAEEEMDIEFDISTDAAEEEMDIEFDISTDAAEEEMDIEFDISTDAAEEEMDIEFDISTDAAEDEMDVEFDIGTDAVEDEIDVGLDIGTDAVEDEIDVGLDIGTDAAEDEIDVEFDIGTDAAEEAMDVKFDIELEEEVVEEKTSNVSELLDVTTALDDIEGGIDEVGGRGLMDVSFSRIDDSDIEDDEYDGEEDDFADDKTFMMPKVKVTEEQSEDEEMSSHLDLAKAYIELGDSQSAETILNEILEQGNDDYKAQAKELLKKMH